MNSAKKETNQVDWEDILSDLERHVKAYRENLFVAEELNPIVFVWSETGKTPMPNPTVDPNDLETWNMAMENAEQAQQRIIKFEKTFNKILPPGKVVTAATLARYARPGVTPEALAMALGVGEGEQNDYPLHVSLDVAKRLADFWRVKKSLPILQHYTQSKGSFGTDNGMRMRWNAAHNYMHPTTVKGNWDELPKQDKFAIMLATKIANPGKSKKDILAGKLYESQRGADRDGKATWTLFRWLRPAQESYYQSERQSYIGRHGQEKARKEVARVEKERHAMVRGDIKPYALIDRYAHENVQQRTHASKQIMQSGKKAEGVKDVSDNSPAIPIEGQHGLTPMPMHSGEASRLKIGRPSSSSYTAPAGASAATPHTVEGYDLPSLFNALNEEKYKLGEGDQKKLQTGRTIKTGAWHRLFQDAKGEGIEINGKVYPLDAKEREAWDKAAARIAVDQGSLHSIGDFDKLSSSVQDNFRKKVIRKLVTNKHQTTTDMKGRTVWLHGTPEMREQMAAERRDTASASAELDPQRALRVGRAQARKDQKEGRKPRRSADSAEEASPFDDLEVESTPAPARRRRTRTAPQMRESTPEGPSPFDDLKVESTLGPAEQRRQAAARQAATATPSTTQPPTERTPAAPPARREQAQEAIPARPSATRPPRQPRTPARREPRRLGRPRERATEPFVSRQQREASEETKQAILQVFNNNLESSARRLGVDDKVRASIDSAKQKIVQEFNDRIPTYNKSKFQDVKERLLELSGKENLEDIKITTYDEMNSFIEKYIKEYGEDRDFVGDMKRRFGKRLEEIESRVRETGGRQTRAAATRAAIVAGARRGLNADQVREMLPEEDLSAPVISQPRQQQQPVTFSPEQIKSNALRRYRRVTTDRQMIRSENPEKYQDMTDDEIDTYLRQASPEVVAQMSRKEKNVRSQVSLLAESKRELGELGLEINPKNKGTIQSIGATTVEPEKISDDDAENIVSAADAARTTQNLPAFSDQEFDEMKEYLISKYATYEKQAETPSLSGFVKYLDNQIARRRVSRADRIKMNFLSQGLSFHLNNAETPSQDDSASEDSSEKSLFKFGYSHALQKAPSRGSLVESVFRKEKDKYDQMIGEYDDETEKARVKSSKMRDRAVAIGERHGVQSPQHRHAMEEYADALSEYEVLIGQRPKIPTRNSVAQALMRQGVEKGGRASLLMLPIAARKENPSEALLKRIDLAIARSFT